MPFYWFVWETSNSFSWYISLEELLCLHGSYNGVSTFLNHNKWCARDRREFPQKTTISHEKSNATKFWFVIALNCLRGGLMLTIINMTRIANTVQQMVRSGSRDTTRMCLRQFCSQCSEDAEIKISLTHRLNHCTEWQGRQLSCPKQLKMFHYWYLSCCETRNVRKLLSNEKWFTCGGILRSFINGEWPECALDGPFHPDGFFLEFHRGSNSR